MENLGKIMLGVGLALVFVGLFLWFFGGKLGWLGHLPGDISVEGKNFRFYAPITTMIIVSIALSLILSLIRKLF